MLKGLGTAIALPWLDAMSWGSRAYAQDPADEAKRFLALYTPNGFNMDHFWPDLSASGALTQASLESSSLAALVPVMANLLVVKGLDNYAGSAQGDGPGDHARGTCTMLTCSHPNKSESDLFIGPSVDQLIAEHLSGLTQFASLEVGVDGGVNTGVCDSGYSCAYSRNISWKPQTSGSGNDPLSALPSPKETNPRLLFDRLFGGFDPSQSEEQIARRKLYKQSILDFVREDAKQLQKKLGPSDVAHLDQYLSGIRDIELRIDTLGEGQCEPGLERPESVYTDRGERLQLFTELIINAFRCDLTRVASVMMANGGSNYAFSGELGIAEGHHELSHHQGVAETKEKIRQIDVWHVAQLLNVIQGLSQVMVGDQTLLDQTTVFFSSECADGNGHWHYNLPVVMAGRVADFQMGRFVDREGSQLYNEPIANLFLAILQDFGSTQTTFGDDGSSPISL